MSDELDVLVIGAGPAGLVTAIELARRGVRCRVVDAAAAPTPGSRCPTLWQRSLLTLDLMGLPVAALARQGLLFERKSFHAGPLQASFPVRQEGERWPLPLLVPQETTERMLTEHLQRLDVRVQRRTAAAVQVAGRDGVLVRLSGPDGTEDVRAGWLVAADGAAGPTRAALGIPAQEQSYPKIRWLQFDARARGPVPLPPDEEVLFHGDGCHLGLVPVSPTRHRVFVSEDAAGAADRPLSPAGLRDLVSRAAPGLELRDLTGHWVHRPRSALAAAFRAGRCLLVGDAARDFPMPVHGFNTAIQDAFNLGWKLAAVVRGGPDELLDSYDAERRALAREVLARTSRVLQFGVSRQPELMVRAIAARPTMPTEVDASYVDGPLGCATDELGPRPGTAAPDGPVRLPYGEGRLLDLGRDGRWLVLAFAGRAEPAELPAGLGPDVRVVPVLPPGAPAVEGLAGRDTDGGLHAAYGADRARLVAVRPDGYLGFSGPGSAVAELTGYLKRVGAAG